MGQQGQGWAVSRRGSIMEEAQEAKNEHISRRWWLCPLYAQSTDIPRSQVMLTFSAWPLSPWGGAHSQPCLLMEKGPGKCGVSWALVMFI